METAKAILQYFFNTNPGTQFRYYLPLIILSIFLIGGSIAFSKFYKQKKKNDFAFKKLFKKTANRMLIFGILFGLLLIFRYENIPYFSMRIILYITIIIFLYFLYRYIHLYKTKYPKEKENTQKTFTPKQKEQTYLPNKNRKKRKK